MHNYKVWKDNLYIIQLFLNKYGKLPCNKSKNIEEKMQGQWFKIQVENYKNKTHIMKNNEIYQEFKLFIKK
jgi:hypothetical protein